MQAFNILFTPQNDQAAGIAQVADSHPIFRALIHAGHVDDVKRLLGMLLVAPLNGLLQLCQRTQIMNALQLLLALAAGENELTLPRRRVGFWFFCHSVGLDAVFP
jgi:hypothetical protein